MVSKFVNEITDCLQVAAIIKARKDILATLRRRRYCEASEKSLESTKLKSVLFGWPFHLRDLVGLGVITSVVNGTNVVYRVRQS